MKLDKIKFARLIALVAQHGAKLDTWAMEDIDNIVDIEIPEPGIASTNHVDRLMFLMTEGKQKIEAIKTYRTLTGTQFKDGKEAVERYWISKLAEYT